MILRIIILLLALWTGEAFAGLRSVYRFSVSSSVAGNPKACSTLANAQVMQKEQTAEIQRLLKNIQEPSMNPLSSEECRKFDYMGHQVMEVIRNWGKTGSSDHEVIAELMQMVIDPIESMEVQSPDLFIICDSKGKIYAAGQVSDFNRLEHFNLDLLISSPESNLKGGGTAAMEHIMKQAILRNKSGIVLKPFDKARGFYIRMGFKPVKEFVPDVKLLNHEKDTSLFIDRDAILKQLELWQKKHSHSLQTK